MSCARRALKYEFGFGAANSPSLPPAVSPSIAFAGFTASDIKATVAAIAFVVTNATRYRVDAEALNAELQQLGLPKENSDGISRPFRIHRDKLTAQASVDSLRLPRVCSAAVRSDVIVASSACGGLLSAVSATSSAAQPTCVYHVSLGLSHGMSGSAPRLAAPDAESTQLLQAAAARSAAASGAARAIVGLGLEPGLAQQAQAALLALNALPLVPAASSGPLSPSEAGPGSASTASTAAARVQPSQRVAFTVSAEKAAALLAELRVARRVMASLAAASSATSAGSAGGAAGAGAGAASAGEA